jgi:hypothetical protein
MNGEVRAIIHVWRMPGKPQPQLFFPRPRKMEATPTKEINTNANQVRVVTSR